MEMVLLKKLNIGPELLEQIKVGALVVCAVSLWVIAYQMYMHFEDVVQMLAALVNKGNVE